MITTDERLEQLERRFQRFRRVAEWFTAIFILATGGSLVLPIFHDRLFSSPEMWYLREEYWLIGWLVVIGVSLLPAAVLLFGPTFQTLHLGRRLKMMAGYVKCSFIGSAVYLVNADFLSLSGWWLLLYALVMLLIASYVILRIIFSIRKANFP